jgi:stage III sporulation protein AA
VNTSWMEWLPSSITSCISGLPTSILDQIEEIRIRQGRPLEICFAGEKAFVGSRGILKDGKIESSYFPTMEDCQKMIHSMSNYSLYALEEELRRGYVTVQGGHRIGIAGRTVLEQGAVKYIRDITCFNIRIARQVIGAANPILPYLIRRNDGAVYNTLIISPPQCGKTTLLRDIARQLSTGITLRKAGWKVGLIDERSELASSYKGVPQYDIGPRTDVLDACPKVEGMMMMIRSMSPDVLIVDEIGRTEDSEAIFEALNSGVAVITTAHGADIADVSKRPSIRGLVQEAVFERYVVLSKKRGVGTVDGIFDGALRPLPLGRLVTSC